MKARKARAFWTAGREVYVADGTVRETMGKRGLPVRDTRWAFLPYMVKIRLEAWTCDAVSKHGLQ